MPEMLAAFAPMLFEAGAEAAPGALSAAAPEALGLAPAAFGSAGSLASAGLPFAAGAGELGSVATGLGSLGISGFGDAAGIAGAFGSSGLPFAAQTASAGLPFAAGAGQIGSTAGSGLNSAISGLSGAAPGLDNAILPATSSPISASGSSALSFPGMGAGAGVDPTAAASGVSGSPFDTAPAVSNWTGASPSAPAGASATSAGGGITDWLSKNSSTLGLGAAGIGASLASPFLSRAVSPGLPNQGKLTATADKAAGQADSLLAQQKALTDPLTTGVLPQAQQQAVDNATNDAVTSVKSKYAGMGLSGSTMELEAINNVKNQAATMKVSMEAQLAQTGLQMGSQALTAMNLTDQVYSSLMNATISQDTALQQAIARMAAGAAQGSAQGTAARK